MKTFELLFTLEAKEQLLSLKNSKSHQNVYKAVGKTLHFLKTNLKHPSLHTHEYSALRGHSGEKVFEAYVQNRTPGAYRIFCYGPGKDYITVVAITPHP